MVKQPTARSAVNRIDLDDQEWREGAACRGLPVELFFPLADQDADYAKSVCRLCGVRNECLEFALAAGERFGVWGGYTPQERRSILTRRDRSMRDRVGGTAG